MSITTFKWFIVRSNISNTKYEQNNCSFFQKIYDNIFFNTHLSVKALQNRHFVWKVFFYTLIFFFCFRRDKVNRQIPTKFSIKIYYDYFEYFYIFKFKITKNKFKYHSQVCDFELRTLEIDLWLCNQKWIKRKKMRAV